MRWFREKYEDCLAILITIRDWLKELAAELRSERKRRQNDRYVIKLITSKWVPDRYERDDISFSTMIFRKVTRRGVIVYSYCGQCGERIRASATLCKVCGKLSSADRHLGPRNP